MPRKKLNIGEHIERTCPKCLSIMKYKTPYMRHLAEIKQTLCRSCSYSIAFNTPQVKQKRSSNSKKYSANTEVKLKRSKNFKENNPNKDGKIWKNKKMSETHKQKLSKLKKEQWNNPSEKMLTDINNNFSCNWGENNPYKLGIPFLLFNKYGNSIAIDKWKNKLSFLVSGEKNPMFGKVSKGGKGISGWYKSWFFRSSLELYYMINVIERFNLKWKSAENSKFKIEYFLDGKRKTYVADFVIDNKYLVEIKPKALQNISQNQIKKEAAINFCKNTNLKYKMCSCKGYSKLEMINMHNNQIIKIQDSKLQRLLK